MRRFLTAFTLALAVLGLSGAANAQDDAQRRHPRPEPRAQRAPDRHRYNRYDRRPYYRPYRYHRRPSLLCEYWVSGHWAYDRYGRYWVRGHMALGFCW